MTLFPDYEPAVRELRSSEQPGLSADRRRTLRQAEAIEDGRHPLTGGPLHPLASRHRDATAPKSDMFTCGSCYFRSVVPMTRASRFPKCMLPDPKVGADAPQARIYSRVSGGPSSDVRAWWPACRDYSPGDSLSSDAARCAPAADHRPEREATAPRITEPTQEAS